MGERPLPRTSALMDALMSACRDAILIIDEDGVIADANEAAGRLFAESQPQGRPVDECVETLSGASVLETLRAEELTGDPHEVLEWIALTEEVRVPVEAHVTNLGPELAPARWALFLRDVGRLHEFRHAARHDGLTGMPNRTYFLRELRERFHQQRSGNSADPSFAILYLDLDRFKVVNDSLGHLVGDRLLQAVARRLARFVRPDDLVARIGGDEFAVLLRRLRRVEDSLLVADRLYSVFDQPFSLDSYEVEVGTSIGVAPFRRDYQDPSEMLRDADLAMYEAKNRRFRYQLFDGSMHDEALQRMDLEMALRRAIRNEEFEVYYQPIVELASEETIGFEALVRWRRPGHGLVSPGDFLSVADETGLIVDIGAFVRATACVEAVGWAHHRPLILSLNLSAREVSHGDFQQHMLEILEASCLPPDRVWLELTEESIMSTTETSKASLDQLRRFGMKVCIDDFGVGYSSLSYLQKLPIDVVKLDRSFVAGTGSKAASILEAMIALVQGLDLSLVAEGVEKEAEINRLTTLGADFGQGYGLARPMPASQVQRYLDATRTPSKTESLT